VLALGGLVVSLVLVLDKWSLLADPTHESVCGRGSGCEVLNTSAMSEIPGIHLPIALLGLAFYLSWLVLTAVRWRSARSPVDDGPGRASAARLVQLAMAIGANIYSVVLFSYSASQGTFCKFCVSLYVVNFLLLLLTIFSARSTPAARPVGLGTMLGIAALTFIAAAGFGFAIWKATLPAPAATPDPLQDPTAPHYDFDTKDHATLGAADAPIHFVEFADFECPHCKEFYKTIEALVAPKGDVVKVTFMSFPLGGACNRSVPRQFHERACGLALLGECANRQGKYPDVAGMLYESGKDTPHAELVDALAGMGLDKGKLEACLADPAALAFIKADIEAALGAAVDGTPALFMNGVQVHIRPLEYYLELVDAHAHDPR